MRKQIELYFMPDEVMLVIEYPSGVVYLNQVGGQVCMQPELEGVLVPLGLEEVVVDTVTRLFDPERPAERPGLDAAVADQLHAILAEDRGTNGIKVDRTRLGECWESWVFVTLAAPTEVPPWSGFTLGARGVLTWPGRR